MKLDILETLNIFPCNGKAPYIKDWQTKATSDPDQIRAWAKQFPGCNWGMPTGQQGIFVVDIDDEETNTQGLAISTYRVNTHRGCHLYYWAPCPIGNRVGWRPGIDIRGSGGYVLVPPSKGYTSINADILTAPNWLLDELSAPQLKPSEPSDGDIVEGGRNDYLMRLGCSMQRKNMTYEAIAAALHAENETRCNPMLPDKEVDAIVNSVTRYLPGDPAQVDIEPTYVKASDLFKDMASYLRNKDAVKGEPTGIDGLDTILGGGKRLGELTVTHAEAKTGKNTLYHYMMHKWLTRGIAIGYASREISPSEEVLPNLLSIDLKKNAWKETTEGDLIVFEPKLKDWPLYFAPGYGTFPLEQLLNWICDLNDKGVKYFFIDHLHYMLHEPEDYKEASKFIKSLKAICKERNISIDLIVQPNKIMEGQRLGLSSIKGGSAIGQALDNLITMQRLKDEQGTPMNIVEIKLERARHKLARQGKSVYLEYDQNTTEFYETNFVPISEESPNRGAQRRGSWPQV